MKWFRWLRSDDSAPTPPPPAEPVSEEPAQAPFAAEPVVNIPAHYERALIALTTKMQHCVERLDLLEERLQELTESVMNTPSHGDVLEVRMHSAKLAAELARATVELRGEIGLASDEARRAARFSRTPENEVPLTMPVDSDYGNSRIEIDVNETPRPAPKPGGNGNGHKNGNGHDNGGYSASA